MSSELTPTTAAGTLTPFEISLSTEREAEQDLMRAIIKAVVIGIPIGIAFFIVLLALALSGQAEWYVIVGLGAILGVGAGALFGMLGGVTIVTHELEDVDRGAPTEH